MTVKATYEGGCHCGKIRFRVRGDLGTAGVCNCSICTKKGIIHLVVAPSDFEVIQGRDELATYQFNTGIAKHTFCKTCGIHPFCPADPNAKEPGWTGSRITPRYLAARRMTPGAAG